MMSSKEIHNLLELPDGIKESNLQKLNLTTKDMTESVAIITDWFKEQPHLPDIIPDKRKVENIYISCKGSIERSKSCLDMYYTLKTIAPEIFSDRDPLYPQLKEVSEGVRFAFIHPLTPEGTRIGCVQFLDSAKFNVHDYFKYAFMTFDIRLHYDNGCDCAYIFDMSQIKMAHITQITPSIVKIVITALQEVLVARIKGIHIVNAPGYADPLIQLIRSILSAKIKSRLHLHKSFDELHKMYDKKLLPKDFGGDLRTLEEIQGDWYKETVALRDWFLEEDKYKTDESKRPGKPVSNEILGTHGTFRKLDVD